MEVTVCANSVALSLGDEIKVSLEQIFSNEIVQLVETIKDFLLRKLVESVTLIKR